MMHSVHALSWHWVDPMQARVRGAVSGYDNPWIRVLADRTPRFVCRAGRGLTTGVGRRRVAAGEHSDDRRGMRGVAGREQDRTAAVAATRMARR
jgi:hypothetical protein